MNEINAKPEPSIKKDESNIEKVDNKNPNTSSNIGSNEKEEILVSEDPEAIVERYKKSVDKAP